VHPYVSYISIVIASIWLFNHFVLNRYVDLYLIFLLIFPAIGFNYLVSGDGVSNPKIELGLLMGNQVWAFIYSQFNDVIYLGPIALSTRLVISIAIVVRLFLQHFRIIFSYMGLSWIIVLVLSVVGLILSIAKGIINEGGITMGFRIAMTMGMLLLPSIVKGLQEFYDDLRKIVFVSYLLLCVGLMNGQWFFVTFGLVPVLLCFRISIRYAFLPIILLLSNQYWNYSTITAVGILVLSFTFYFINRSTAIVFRNRYFYFFLVLFPLLFTLWVLNAPSADAFELYSMSDYAKFKLYGDRKPIWDEVLIMIVNYPFVLPAGQIFEVYFSFLNSSINWPGGAHNVFLEFGRQLGGLCMVLLSAILLKKLMSYKPNLSSLIDRTTLSSFMSIYFIFSITGNSLIYDGVGSLYWLLFGQFLNLTTKEY
jgi:hypothetical protein